MEVKGHCDIIRRLCATDQQHGLLTEQLLLEHLEVSLLLFQLAPDVLLSAGKKTHQGCACLFK